MAANKSTAATIEGLELRQLYSGSVYSAKLDAIPHLYTREYIAQPLATFTHPATMNTTSVTALISWGDGASEGYSTLENLTAVTETQMAVTCGQGIHSYAKPGTYNLKVTFSENGKVLATTRKAISLTQNSAGGRSVRMKTADATPVVLGTFTSATAPASELTISWGDGQKTTAVVTPLKNHQYRVSGSCTYLKAGFYRVRVLDNTSNLLTFPSPLTPLASDVLGSTAVVHGPTKAAPTPAVTLSGATNPLFYPRFETVATVNGLTPGGFTRMPRATIEWQGVTEDAQVEVVDGKYVVIGDTFGGTGEQQLQATVNLFSNDHIDRSKDTLLATVTESLVLEPTTRGAIPVTAVAGTAFSGLIGNISATPSRIPVSLKVTWGDAYYALGFPSGGVFEPGDPVTITQTSDGQYQFSATHTYSSSGSYEILGTIHYSDGSTDFFQDVAYIVDNASELPVGSGV